MQGVLQRQGLKKSVDQRRDVTDKLALKDISFPNHQSSRNYPSNADIVNLMKIVGKIHNYTDHQHEKNHKLFKSHKGREWHNSYAVRGKDVNRAHNEGIGKNIKQLLFAKSTLFTHLIINVHDEYPLDHENLFANKGTVE